MRTNTGEQLYSKGLELKKYSLGSLRKRSSRSELLRELLEIKRSVDILLLELRESDDYAPEYFNLALEMNGSLFECISALASNDRRLQDYVRRRIHGFHNLPRAFLPSYNPARISAREALDYYRANLDVQ